jgi:hypothetical protein
LALHLLDSGSEQRHPAHLNQLIFHQERLEHQAAAADELLERCTALQQRQSRAGATSIVQTEETTWWMDDATLRFAMDSMRLHGQTVLTVDAEALTVSPDEVPLSPAALQCSLQLAEYSIGCVALFCPTIVQHQQYC